MQAFLGVLRVGVVLATVVCVTVLLIWLPRPQTTALASDNGDDFVCEIPDVTKIVTAAGDPDYSHPLPACEPFAKFATETHFSYVNIANAWKAAGMNMDHCAAAVVIAAGECQPPAGAPASACDLVATGASGLFQTDWVLTAPASEVGSDAATRVLNPCENIRYGYGNIVKPPSSYDRGCYTGDGGSVTPPLKITCGSKETCPVGGGVGGCDWDYSQGHCNWLGPFCHWQVNKNTGTAPTCCAWTGGANCPPLAQPDGFPGYYQSMFVSRSGQTPEPVGAGLSQQSYKMAMDVCAQATGVPT